MQSCNHAVMQPRSHDIQEHILLKIYANYIKNILYVVYITATKVKCLNC
jgi:hypothetical protein